MGGSGGQDVFSWLREHGRGDIADLIQEIEGQWKAEGKKTRRNWWDVLSGGRNGAPQTVAGKFFPVFAEAQLRQGKRKTANATSIVPSAAPQTLATAVEFTPTSLPKAVKTLFELNGYDVWGPMQVHGAEIDLIAKKRDPFAGNVYLEVTVEHVDNDKYGKDVSKFAIIKRQEPRASCILVSSRGFSLPVRERAAAADVETYTYEELWKKFQQFDPYVQRVLGTAPEPNALAELSNIYEEPLFDDKLGRELAVDCLTKWRGASDPKRRWLIVVGDYGTGKTALTQVLQYRWTRESLLNPMLPIPFRIELRSYSRQFDARGLLHHFLDSNGLSHIPLDFVMTLIRQGRVILLLDGYDEMAQYMVARERRSCLEALAGLSADGARGILTSRPNYFSEAEEFQVFEILYSSFSKERNILVSEERDLIEKERQVDNLLQAHFMERFERSLADLTHDQTSALVRRRLADDEQGARLVLDILDRIYRNTGDGYEASLSGKPVIVSYLLDVISELKETGDAGGAERLTEWSIYDLIVRNLMVRDFRRSDLVMPTRRREFLRKLAVALSQQSSAEVGEEAFQQLVQAEFASEIRRMSISNAEAGERYFADLRSSGTLTRSESGVSTTWRFSHNSLREFLAAEHILHLAENSRLLEFEIPVSAAMRSFVRSRPSDDKEKMLATVRRNLDSQRAKGSGVLLALCWDALLSLHEGTDDPARIVLNALGGLSVLRGLVVRRITTEGVDLRGASLNGSELSDCSFRGAKLEKVSFEGAVLDSVDFSRADLSGAVFKGAFLAELDLTGTTLRGADFAGVSRSDISIVIRDAGNVQRFEGAAALGFLEFHDARVDEVDGFYRWMHHPNFDIVDKICRRLSEQAWRQRRGLVQRGSAREDTGFASGLVDHLIRRRLIEEKIDTSTRVRLTDVGRQKIGAFVDHHRMFEELEEYLRETL